MFCIPSIILAQSGTSGAAFMKIGLSPRAGGMGEAYVAVADDAGGIYYNPAGILLNKSPQIELAHRAWIDDIQSQSLSATLPWDDIALGLNITTTTVPNIEIRTRPGDPEGTFTSRNFTLGGSIAYRIMESVTIGGTAKYVFEKIFVDEWSGVGIDLGIHYRTPVDGLALGVSLLNLGSMSGTNTPSINLPTMLRGGAAYKFPVDVIRSEVAFAADAVQLTRDRIFHSYIGGEIVFDRTIALRLGYQTGFDFRNITAGVGIRYRSFALDYCIIPMSQQAGTAQTIGLGITL
ncbi:MAG: PorV/PorQ family protein [Bacteroidota bacterium]